MPEALQLHCRRFAVGRVPIHGGWTHAAAYILAGGAQQIADLQILGLRSVLFRAADRGIDPVAVVEASEMRSSECLRRDASRRPCSGPARDEVMVVENPAGVGGRDAVERAAHFLPEQSARSTPVGPGTREGSACPSMQHHLADALGLSEVHVDRPARTVGPATFRQGLVRAHDVDRLLECAGSGCPHFDYDGAPLPAGSSARRTRAGPRSSLPSTSPAASGGRAANLAPTSPCVPKSSASHMSARVQADEPRMAMRRAMPAADQAIMIGPGDPSGRMAPASPGPPRPRRQAPSPRPRGARPASTRRPG